MNKLINQFKLPYDFKPKETSHPLAREVPVKIHVNGNSYIGVADVSLELLGLPRIFLSCKFPEATENIVESKEDKVEFFINDKEIFEFTLSPSKDVTTIELRLKTAQDDILSNTIYGDGQAKMRKADFHLFNFMEIKGYATNDSNEESLDMSYGDWNIIIKSFPDTEENVYFLRTQGGYRRTHIVHIRRKDNSSNFTGRELKECLYAFYYATSFAKGGWSVPICPTGYNAKGEPVWISWSSPLEAWSGPFRWLDASDYSQLPIFFASFMEKIDNDEKWRDVLYEAISWYINANNSTYLDKKGGIVLTQAALEVLAYEYLIDKKEVVGENAHIRFENLFKNLKFYDAQPDTLDIKLDTLGIESEKMSLPEIFIKVRNTLAHHFDVQNRQSSKDIYEETWKLGLWYLELSILAICEYSGNYKNRFTGENQLVPWLS